MNGVEFKFWLGRYHQSEKVRPLVMGVLNLTPDSFFDGGAYSSKDKAIKRAMNMISQGADLLDIGGESSRPGSRPISEDEELARIIPIIENLRQYTDCCISVDTYKSNVMQAALAAGADIINDIYSLEIPGTLDVIRQYQVPICLMHMHGVPETMAQTLKPEMDIISEVINYFKEKVFYLEQQGIGKELLMIDPGIGFGKTLEQNLFLIKYLENLQVFNIPILLGVSRKRFIGDILSKSVADRMVGSVTSNLIGYLNGANMFRVHDVAETKDALLIAEKINQVQRVDR